MTKAVKVGDTGTDHDGFPPTPVTAGSPDVNFDGVSAARVGDPLAPHDKPKHPPHGRSIASGSSTVKINGKPAAITGGSISCGGVTIGSASVNIGDVPPSSTSNSFVPVSIGTSKKITSLSFSYGANRETLTSTSRHYTDINLHAKTTGYSPGESVSVKLNGVIDKTIVGHVDDNGEVFVANILQQDHLEIEGKIQ